jgi:hypothetical protein
MSIRAIMNLVESKITSGDNPANPMIAGQTGSAGSKTGTREEKLQGYADYVVTKMGKKDAIKIAQMILAQTEQGTIEEQITGQLHLLTEGVGSALGGVVMGIIKRFGKVVALEIARRIMDRATKI